MFMLVNGHNPPGHYPPRSKSLFFDWYDKIPLGENLLRSKSPLILWMRLICVGVHPSAYRQTQFCRCKRRQ